MRKNELKEFLDQKFLEYNNPDFIESDPISIPHRFSLNTDIEIAGLLTATIAWGQRKTIINNANKLMDLMDGAPHDFIVNHIPLDLKRMESFVHRTFNASDLLFFISALQNIYRTHSSLESLFLPQTDDENLANGIENFRQAMFGNIHEKRSEKHISSPAKGSAAKRLIMFIRVNKVA